MSKIYLPTSEQMNTTLENLSRIAGALGTKEDTSTWAGIQRVVKSGNAPRLFPIGSQLIVPHSVYGDRVYDVVAHDYFKSADDENAHTMTVMCHDIIGVVQFDGSEAFYYAENELPMGTYNVTLDETYASWVAGTYQFTLTKVLPAGGQLCISGASNVAMTERNITSYQNRTTTNAIETVAITVGKGGTSLGTFGKELNNIRRVPYGSNNYKESAIRQFLNSSAKVGEVWTPQTKFDRPPSWMTNLAGFVGGLDEGFLSVIGKVIVPCVANDTYESPDSTTVKGARYTVFDRFYLASQTEIFGTTSGSKYDGSILLPYYEGVTNADRIKYRNGSAMAWRSRSPFTASSISVEGVSADGSTSQIIANDTLGCVPVCTIV